MTVETTANILQSLVPQILLLIEKKEKSKNKKLQIMFL